MKLSELVRELGGTLAGDAEIRAARVDSAAL